MLMDYSQPDKAIARYHSADEGKRIERFKGRMPKTFSHWSEAHNEYTEMFYQYGLIGIGLIFLFFRELFIRVRLCMENKDVRILFGCVLAYLSFSLVQFPFHLARTAIFFPVILGALFAYTDKDWKLFIKGEKDEY